MSRLGGRKRSTFASVPKRSVSYGQPFAAVLRAKGAARRFTPCRLRLVTLRHAPPARVARISRRLTRRDQTNGGCVHFAPQRLVSFGAMVGVIRRSSFYK